MTAETRDEAISALAAQFMDRAREHGAVLDGEVKEVLRTRRDELASKAHL